MWRGEWAEAEAVYRRAVELEPQGCFLTGMVPAGLRLVQVYNGTLSERRVFQQSAVDSVSGDELTIGRWERVLGTVEAVALLGDRATAADLHRLVAAGLDRGAFISWSGLRLIETIAGIAAAAGEQWDTAQQHLETALRQAHELPHVIAQPETRRWYAWMLTERNADGDRGHAWSLLEEAVETYQRLGMPRHVEMTKESLKTVL